MNNNLYTLIDSQADLSVIQASFNEIPTDTHFGSSDRFRTQSRFSYDNGTITRLAPVALFQSSDINPIENYGGIERDYPELPEGIEETKAFQKLVEEWAGNSLGDSFDFSVHQIRTTDDGDPVPEGRHRDGYEKVGVFVANRWNLTSQSATTTIWKMPEDEIILDPIALQPGSMIVFDDRRVLHDATPLERQVKSEHAGRDVLIITYPDHGKIATEGEIKAINE